MRIRRINRVDAVKFLQERNRMYESGAATPGIGLEDDYDDAEQIWALLLDYKDLLMAKEVE